LENGENRFLEIIVSLLFKVMIPLIAILTINSITLTVNIPMLLLLNVPCVLYMVKVLLDIKHVAENVHLYIPNRHSNLQKFNPLFWEITQSEILTDKQLELLYRWAKGETWRSLNLHPTLISRLCRKYVLYTLKRKEPLPLPTTE